MGEPAQIFWRLEREGHPSRSISSTVTRMKAAGLPEIAPGLAGGWAAGRWAVK